MYPDEYQDLKIPPHSIEAEQSVLGSLLMDGKAYEKIKSTLCIDDFYKLDHKKIFEIIRDLSIEDLPIDFVTVNERLDKSDDGLSTYLYTMAKDTPSSANVVGYAKIVKDKSVLRSLISIGADIQESAFSADGVPAMEKVITAQDAIVQVAQDNRETKSKIIRPKDMTQQIINSWNIRASGQSLMGLKTGFEQLDEYTQGLGKGWLVIVGARPAMGKTSFMMALEQATMDFQDKPIATVSMEMPEGELLERHTSYMSGVPLSKIRSGDVIHDEPELAKASTALKKFNKYKYFVDASGGQTPQELRDSVIAMNNQSLKEYGEPLAAVFVDYLQIMRASGNNQNRVGDVSEFSGELKRLAKDLAIPVVALSQLNRSVEQRPNKRPVMSDLRDSGAIEQDADVIMFLYRDEVYEKDSDDKGNGEIIIAKNRHGRTGTVRAGWNGMCTKWFDRYPNGGEF